MNGMSADEEFNLIETAMGTCMRERGWEYIPAIIPDSAISEPRTVGELRAFRHTYGYGFATVELLVTEGERQSMTADPNLPYIDQLSDVDEQRFYEDREGTFYGEPSDVERAHSCRGEAEAQVRASIPYYDERIRDLIAPFIEAADKDPVMLVAMATWRSCMEASGYDFTELNEPEVFIAEQLPTSSDLEGLAETEIRVATDDFDCRYPDLFVALHTVADQFLDQAESVS